MVLLHFDGLPAALLLSRPLRDRWAARVLPLLKNHNLLLVTLVLGNAAAMQTLPIFFDRIVPTYLAIILSVTAILFFGEIFPQALCTGPHRLAIAGYAMCV